MDGDIYKILALRVRERRRKAGLTLEALAERAGITGPFIAHIEAGRKRPTLDTIAKLAHALDTTVCDLVKSELRLNDKRPYVEQVARCLAGLSEKQCGTVVELVRAAAALARRR